MLSQNKTQDAAAPARSPNTAGPHSHGPLAGIDVWMGEHPWHPRFTPFFVYILLLVGVGLLKDLDARLYPVGYAVQCLLVGGLLWRYRKLLPELTLSFHWLAIPVGVFVAVAWIWLGMCVAEWDSLRKVGFATFTSDLFSWAADPQSVGDDVRTRFTDAEGDFFEPVSDGGMGVTIGWTAFSLRLLGMSLLVPLFEELFIRSLMLRSFNNARQTGKVFFGVLQDTPLIGERLMTSKWGQRHAGEDVSVGDEFEKTPLGQLTVFGVIASTMVFMISHVPRDWPGIWVCGVAYCLLLAATRAKGLGPVVWAHGVTNALLWVYTLQTGDWRFL